MVMNTPTAPDKFRGLQWSQQKIAKIAGVSQPFVCRVLNGRAEFSPFSCVAIEAASFGKVSRKDLRPKDWQDIWPELIGS